MESSISILKIFFLLRTGIDEIPLFGFEFELTEGTGSHSPEREADHGTY